MNEASLCVQPYFSAAHGGSIHFLQGPCYRAHFRNILKRSSQTSVFRQVCLRSGKMSLSHDKQETDFEVFLTYISSSSLFVFFEVESKKEATTISVTVTGELGDRRSCRGETLQSGRAESDEPSSLRTQAHLHRLAFHSTQTPARICNNMMS